MDNIHTVQIDNKQFADDQQVISELFGQESQMSVSHMVLLCLPSQLGLVKFGWELSDFVWFYIIWFGVWLGGVKFGLVWMSVVWCG